MPSPELSARVQKLQQHLRDQRIDVAILNQNSDLFYYTGSTQPLYLMVPAEGGPILAARKSITRIQEEARVGELEPFHGTKDLIAILERHGIASAKRIGMTLDATTFATVGRFQQLFSGAEMADLSWEIRRLRMVKSEVETAIQVRAGAVMAEVSALVKAGFRPGMTELEMSAVLENHFRLSGHGVMIRCRREGGELAGFGVCSSGVNTLAGTKFDGICAGKGLSAAVPFGAGGDPIAPGAPVILDYSVVLDGYHVDQTRMFSWGAPSEEVSRAYAAMLEIEETLIEGLKPGRAWEEIYSDALALADKAGYAEVFMGVGTERVRFVGHGVGLELDEPPFLAPKWADRLEAGMVVALEPKVAIPGVGVVGIEDTLVVRESGAQWITTCPKEFVVV